MRLKHGIDLGYCTNIHRGESWEETFATLRDYTLRVKERVCADGEPYGIGLRLGADAARELATGEALAAFKAWLEENGCYVFTINGFPYGKFHGTRVKEQVYRPDWTEASRTEYTKLLFDLLVELVPEGGEGSVSTLPGSFKEFITDEGAQGDAIVEQLGEVCAHVEALREASGKDLHLGLEPEPLGWFETSAETVAFFERFRARWGGRFDDVLGVNYDTCHLAVEYEEAGEALGRLAEAKVRISKLHLSSALKLEPTDGALERLREFGDGVYLHQVVVRDGEKPLRRFRDLGDALESGCGGDEWRVHFHVPVHAQPDLVFGDTRDHLSEALDVLAANPAMCRHLEIETYTWEVLPTELRTADVVDQLAKEYEWTFGELRAKGLA